LFSKDKYLDGFSKMVPILHAYDRQVPDRTVMAFVPNEELRQVKYPGFISCAVTRLVLEKGKLKAQCRVIYFGNYFYRDESWI
jgi:hypothetical protein